MIHKNTVTVRCTLKNRLTSIATNGIGALHRENPMKFRCRALILFVANNCREKIKVQRTVTVWFIFYAIAIGKANIY